MSSKKLAQNMRLSIAQMIHNGGATHIGSCYSIVDILSVLYEKIMNYDINNSKDSSRDIFILSKGHATAALYSVLAEKGFFDKNILDQYCKNNSKLWSHVTANIEGVEISSGSLGHGLPIGCGFALSAKYDNKDKNVFVLVGDGEMNEGSIWESLLFAAHNKLDNLVLIIDYNKYQGLGKSSDVLNLEPLKDKLNAFNFNTFEINGHDHDEIFETLSSFVKTKNKKPTAVICNTIKGKGVDFMESNNSWHYNKVNADDLNNIFNQIKNEK